MGKRINDKSGPHRVSSQEDEVAIAQDLCDRMARDIARRPAADSCESLSPARGEPRFELLSWPTSTSTRVVPTTRERLLLSISSGINKDEVSYAKAGEVFRHQRPHTP